MPFGILIDCAAIACGGLAGTACGKFLPQKIRDFLPIVFSICCLGIAISLIVQAHSLSAVMLSIILGSAVGSLIDIDNAFKTGTSKAAACLIKGNTGVMDAEAMSGYLSLVVVLCFGTTTILGALTEGLSGDSSILIMKSILDFFTAIVFACSFGAMTAVIAIPQLIICLTLYFLASLIMPIVSASVLCDFKACGGLITFATGIRMCKLKDIKSTNMLPSLILVIPFSILFSILTR